jgi:hypothetical protein
VPLSLFRFAVRDPQFRFVVINLPNFVVALRTGIVTRRFQRVDSREMRL